MTDQTKPAGAVNRTDLAYDRTNLAHERTLMAWVRTATSLIAFGFTVYKFFELEEEGKPIIHNVIGPRFFAMFMIAIGLFSLVLATIEHRWYKNQLKQEDIKIPFSLAGLVAGLISILGIVAMVSVILRL